MSKNNNTFPGRGLVRPTPNRHLGRLCIGPPGAGMLRARRAWCTHAYRDSQVIFYGHDLPSEFCGRRR